MMTQLVVEFATRGTDKVVTAKFTENGKIGAREFVAKGNETWVNIPEFVKFLENAAATSSAKQPKGKG